MTNWIYQGAEITSIEQVEELVGFKPYGFVYNIVAYPNNQGREYIGMKQMTSYRSRFIGKRELLKEGKAKFRRKKDKKKGGWRYYEEVFKESDWKLYTGSNKLLNKHIEEDGVTYTKYILKFVEEKNVLLYEETKAILCTNALEEERFYNEHVLKRFFKKNIMKSKKKK